jgi:hypothetical protein
MYEEKIKGDNVSIGRKVLPCYVPPTADELVTYFIDRIKTQRERRHAVSL